ncbi:Endonuclease/exonuclease/phosphatase family domain-containing protein [Schistosoma japonicum]|uniref:Endonuclease/exonuclease/phosphatase family domain-containing protein n=2 Tax=Schistosoma japonicum TaxID=6182 RepID=A0A4Z2CLS2_SCHJA|nr:Endonuclease/exonuclease/phosphatase family domain-containing protein 1 [Schistosoma japonicum]TNN05165.1 Endonuclease/exonuclease/phosphatase family domain-containing protein [Schistosoma japonicum]
MPCFCLCFWRCFKNKLIAKNAKILKEILYRISNADNLNNEQINYIIQKIYLAILNEESTILLKNLESSIKNSHLDEFHCNIRIYNQHSDTVKRHTEAAAVSQSSNNNIFRFSKHKFPEKDHGLTKSQLQLILRMEGVRDWLNLVASCGLLNELDPPLPIIPSVEKYIRIGSWNLNRFDLKKAKHPGFMEVVCLTILRMGVSLILLQEVSDPSVVDYLCNELNCPSLPHVKQWVEKNPSAPPNWKASCSVQPTGSMFRAKEYAVFLYNSRCGIHISRTSLLEKYQNLSPVSRKSFTRSPCGASCRIRCTHLVIISVHLKASGLRNSQIGKTIAEIESLGYLVQAFYETQPSGTHLIIAGDFNLFPTHEAYRVLREHGLWPVLKGEHQTTLNHSEGRSNHLRAYDNAWLSADLSISSGSTARWTGDSGVILKGLRHPLIPEETGSGANGLVSDHAPIWFDINLPYG